ncbi:unnamed protein product [Brassicogethes aeneus]|uniref:Uncharacterized protein n=1 Tax=Brassicogethes aeneus TaxID=1431903 RepID=A0A9P0BEX9_BRAAE|nr:unnamed protein product [Brassicogethes aeneus]
MDTGNTLFPITTTYEGSLDCIERILKEEGYHGYYKGLGALILQHTTMLVLVLYADYLGHKYPRFFYKFRHMFRNRTWEQIEKETEEEEKRRQEELEKEMRPKNNALFFPREIRMFMSDGQTECWEAYQYPPYQFYY